MIVGEYKKAMDSGVIDDQLWYIYEEASNILQDLKKGAIQGLNAFNSEEVRKVWVKRRTQQVAILCGLGNGKAAELGTSVIVNEGNLIFRVNLDGADDDAVTAYTHAIKSFAEHFVRALLEKGGLVDRAIELHKKFHKFRFYKIQGLMQNSEPSTDVREQNKLMNALPLVKHKKKKDLQKEGDNKSGGGAGGGDSSSQPPPPVSLLTGPTDVYDTAAVSRLSRDAAIPVFGCTSHYRPGGGCYSVARSPSSDAGPCSRLAGCHIPSATTASSCYPLCSAYVCNDARYWSYDAFGISRPFSRRDADASNERG